MSRTEERSENAIDFFDQNRIDDLLGLRVSVSEIRGHDFFGNGHFPQPFDDLMAGNELAAGIGALPAANAEPDRRGPDLLGCHTEIDHPDDPLRIEYRAIGKYRTGIGAFAAGETGRCRIFRNISASTQRAAIARIGKAPGFWPVDGGGKPFIILRFRGRDLAAGHARRCDMPSDMLELSHQFFIGGKRSSGYPFLADGRIAGICNDIHGPNPVRADIDAPTA